MAEHWNRLSRAVITAPAWQFKKCLDNSPKDMVEFLESPVQSQELDFNDSCGVFQPTIFYSSMNFKSIYL